MTLPRPLDPDELSEDARAFVAWVARAGDGRAAWRDCPRGDWLLNIAAMNAEGPAGLRAAARAGLAAARAACAAAAPGGSLDDAARALDAIAAGLRGATAPRLAAEVAGLFRDAEALANDPDDGRRRAAHAAHAAAAAAQSLLDPGGPDRVMAAVASVRCALLAADVLAPPAPTPNLEGLARVADAIRAEVPEAPPGLAKASPLN
jgi:hypothetical protein